MISSSESSNEKTKYLGIQVFSITLKERVFLKLNQFPNIKTRELCRLLDLDYHQSRETIWSYRSEWRKTKSIMSRALKAQTHRARAACFALKSFDRKLALRVGWIQSKNRNRALIWKVNPSYGRIIWYQNGKIIIHIKKPQIVARVKRLLCFAFFNTGLLYDPRLLNPFLEPVHWHGASDVFETGKKLPYLKINKYKASHGLEILVGDTSHPTSVEVNWVHPDWLERLELIQKHNIQTIEDLSRFLKELVAPRPLRKDSKRMIV